MFANNNGLYLSDLLNLLDKSMNLMCFYEIIKVSEIGNYYGCE